MTPTDILGELHRLCGSEGYPPSLDGTAARLILAARQERDTLESELAPLRRLRDMVLREDIRELGTDDLLRGLRAILGEPE